ncbi:UDP-glucose/GDP-mannose dehydrogenase family protein [Corallococcus sp. CA049B]|uniref:UDP-glucose dehydrogenase family protein n=1 Tax=Corallococcus sp. CA049B TaxID=2316730 RepID=UPI000EA275E7|nr:UDP-glucose/GDP-mannose dehydrogenase family protein [Corallococcus sp. CA049B]NOJ97602.1 UDP-glucose/GDP-mannose dehydrogenase family protein [Corallococcus coralloides]RKG78118.1 UDP-glucose/GDP-mannose dehydrogenase family protein [Corallococcus sp. CA049B]
MRIAIIGSGYVGLVAGTCFADSGNDVACVDIDERKIRMLQDGQVPIYEPGLEELIKKNVKEKRLTFTTNLAEGVQNAQAVFIAVGTPEGESGEADLQYVLAAAQAVGRAMKQYTVVVDKSTVPVGTADKVREAIAKVTDVEFDVVSNPEFLKEGAALDDFFKPDRVVIGADTERARNIMGELYAPFVRTENPILFMDTRSAELTKYAANAMLATRISFMNDVSALCEKVGADVDFVRKGLGADKRIGYPFLFPGVGYGGSCFPKDVKALVTTAREYGLELDLLRAVERTNERQKKLLVNKAVKHYGSLEGKKFGVWGLAFKPKTDDMREAPSIEVIEGLIGKGASVIAHDPVASHAAKRVFGDRIRYAELPYDALEGVDGLFVVTEWNEFRHPDFARMKSLMKSPVVFDGRNIFQPARMREQGFTYFGIGRK